MNDEWSESLEPGDPLYRAAQALRAPVPVPDGLPERVVRRRIRQRRQRMAMSGGGVVAAIALMAVVLSPPAPEQLVAPLATANTTIGDGTTAALAVGPQIVNDRVTFVLDAPASQSVALVGDFNGWRSDATQLHHGDGGKWEVTVSLAQGRYRYSYLVDQREWRADGAPIPDDYGRPTSVVTVVAEP